MNKKCKTQKKKKHLLRKLFHILHIFPSSYLFFFHNTPPLEKLNKKPNCFSSSTMTLIMPFFPNLVRSHLPLFHTLHSSLSFSAFFPALTLHEPSFFEFSPSILVSSSLTLHSSTLSSISSLQSNAFIIIFFNPLVPATLIALFLATQKP